MKTLLVTISATTLLLLGQSAMAFEQINNENSYNSAYSNGWVSESSQDKFDMVKPAYVSQSSNVFQQINNENDFEAAYSNGWVSPETAAEANLDLMKASYRSDTVDMIGRFEDSLSINYLTTK
jgi:hypothetical protein